MFCLSVQRDEFVENMVCYAPDNLSRMLVQVFSKNPVFAWDD